MCRLEPETAERMVFSLSKLLRYSLDGSREQVTLKEDLGHLNNYLSILEKRFGSRFEYKINVEQECMQCLIRRIQLLYGHPYGVEIRSLEGHGTTLVVTLPAVHDTGQGENNDASCNDSGR